MKEDKITKINLATTHDCGVGFVQSHCNTLGAVISSDCPFEVGEIVVFESWLRCELYISRVMQIHIDYWGNGCMPTMTKATLEQKQQWYENGQYEMVI
jgi:hypothetical protein